MSATVRLAEAADLAAVYALRHEVFVLGQDVPEEMERDEHDDTCDHAVAVRTAPSSRPAGCSTPATAPGPIGRMAVTQAARGTGLGAAVLRPAGGAGPRARPRDGRAARPGARPRLLRPGRLPAVRRHLPRGGHRAREHAQGAAVADQRDGRTSTAARAPRSGSPGTAVVCGRPPTGTIDTSSTVTSSGRAKPRSAAVVAAAAAGPEGRVDQPEPGPAAPAHRHDDAREAAGGRGEPGAQRPGSPAASPRRSRRPAAAGRARPAPAGRAPGCRSPPAGPGRRTRRGRGPARRRAAGRAGARRRRPARTGRGRPPRGRGRGPRRAPARRPTPGPGAARGRPAARRGAAARRALDGAEVRRPAPGLQERAQQPAAVGPAGVDAAQDLAALAPRHPHDGVAGEHEPEPAGLDVDVVEHGDREHAPPQLEGAGRVDRGHDRTVPATGGRRPRPSG